MASRKGPKSRKARKGSAAVRAYKSMPQASRAAIRKDRGGTVSRADKVAVGTSVRKARIKRGTNPNTGSGSGVKHALRRASKTGLITNAQRKKALATLTGGGAAYTHAVATAKGRTGYGGSQAKRGAAIAANTREVRKSRKAWNRKQAAAGTSARVGKFSGKRYTKKS